MTALQAFLYGLAAGAAGFAIISASRIDAGQLPWDLPGQSRLCGVLMYTMQLVLYLALGGFAGWMTLHVNPIATVIFAGLAGPPALMKYVSETRGGSEKGVGGG